MTRPRELLLVLLAFIAGTICAGQAMRLAEKRQRNERTQEIVQAVREVNRTISDAMR